jgi:hypothetical protein
MKPVCTFAQVAGAVLCGIGVAGVFVRISSDDGALAVAGAVLFGASLI